MTINTSSSAASASAKTLSSSFSGTTNGFGNQTSTYSGKETNNGGPPSIRTATEKPHVEPPAPVNTATDNTTGKPQKKTKLKGKKGLTKHDSVFCRSIQ
jgi:hypothetical protein